LIPIADRHQEFARQAMNQMKAAGMRVEIDDSSDRMGNKIRKAQEQKVPYMLVIGDREVEAGTVAVRLRIGEDEGAMPVEDFIARAQSVIAEKTPAL
jgi:threonyl-tRNA synthetase